MTAPGTDSPGRMLDRTERGLARLQLALRRRVDGLLQGDRPGHRPGPGGETGMARPYRPGQDDVRRIDWSVTARTGELHVRSTVSDHELETWVLLDGSASMQFGTTAMEKQDLAIAAVAAVGALTEAPGNRLGVAVLSADTVQFRRPAPGRATQRALLLGLLDAPRRAPGPDAGADLAAGLDRLRAQRRGRGLRVVVSDLLDGDGAIPRWERPLRALAARHEVIVVEVADRRDRELPDVGALVLTDPETGRTREIRTDARLRERFAAAAAAHRDTTAAAVRRSGAHHLRLDTGSDWVPAVARFAAAHRRTRRLAR